MKLHLLAGTSLLALAAALPAAHAGTVTFKFSGKIVSYLVPSAGTYKIVAFGAQGGSSGGLGAKIGGDFKLTKGENLLISAGGEGASGFYSGSGGGGSFVVEKLPKPLGDIPLVVAGGGGGGGGGGGTTHAGGGGGGSYAGGGGTDGKGGAGGGFANGYGGGGGGFVSSGGNTEFAQGGGSFALGLAGGGGSCGTEYGQPFGCANGGFGGGGGGGIQGSGGGGGGYSGGGGGGFEGGGGGGGSFDAGTKKILDAAFNSGNGLVRITELAATATASPALIDASLTSSDPPVGGDPPAVPEPASAALLGAGLAGFAGFAARRRPARPR